MAIRFIIGRAGTGKTHHCVEALAGAMRENPLGPPLIWLVPEQTTFNAERMLVTHPQVRGTMRTTVTGFRRLMRLAADDLSIDQGKQIGDLGRMILLENLVQQNRGKLILFGRVADRPGFIAALDRMLRELLQNGHSPQSLRQIAAQLGEKRADAAVAGKLADLALLLDAWQTALLERHLDSDLLQQRVADRLGESSLVRQARIWLDAFSAMNLLEIRMLTALAQTAASVEITLLADPDSPAMRDPHAILDELSPFYRTERLYRQLMRTFETAGVAIHPPILFRGLPHRFVQSTDLARIERDLFLPEPPPSTDPAPPHNIQLLECANPATEVQAAAQQIRQLIAADPTLRYRDIGLIIPDLQSYQDAVRRVFAHHRIPHFVDARRPITHHPLVELLRTAVMLPLNGFAQEDLILLTKTGLTNISEQDANVLENYLLGHGISRHDLATPFIYAAANLPEDSDDAPLTDAQQAYLLEVNVIRRTLHSALEPWFEIARQAALPSSHASPVTIDALAGALFALLQRFDVENKITALMDQAAAAGNAELVLVHQQAWRQMVNLLETLHLTLQGRPGTLADFSRTLSMALESLTLGLIPPTLDQVLVSSVTRSRHPEMRIAMILGALETNFPHIAPEDPLLNDFQRQAFNNATGNSISAGSTDDYLEAKFLDYIAFTRAHERLIISYPVADHKGRAVVRSHYISRLCTLFPGLKPRIIDSDAQFMLEHIATRDDLLSSVLRWGRSHVSHAQPALYAPADDDTVRMPRKENDLHMAGAYDWLISQPNEECQSVHENSGATTTALRGRASGGPNTATNYVAVAPGMPADTSSASWLDRAWRALLPSPPVQINPALAAQFYKDPLRMSVSQLEKFGACPLQYFMHYTMGLRPRFMLQLEMLDIGILYHRILERMYDCIIDGTLAWPQCDQAAVRQMLQRQVHAAAQELHAELAATSPQYAKVLLRAQRNIAMVLESQRRAASRGTMRPAATELVFGRPNDSIPTTGAKKISLPVLSIPTPSGRTVGLNGKIDRVDLSRASGKPVRKALVIDYKSGGQRTLDLHKIYHGITLQLPIYLLVLQNCGHPIADSPLNPIAAFFVGLTPRRSTQTSPAAAVDPASDEFYQQFKPRGILDASQIGLLDNSIGTGPGMASKWYPFARIKRGDLGKRANDAVEHAEFSAILRFTQHKIAEMVDRLAAGSIAPHPYQFKNQIPCDHCDFLAVCPFDRINGAFRQLSPMDRIETLEQMRRELL